MHKQFFRILLASAVCAGTHAGAAAPAPAPQEAVASTAVPSGSPFAETIGLEFALYFPKAPASDPMRALRQRIGRDWPAMTFAAGAPDAAPKVMTAWGRMEMDVPKKYAVPSVEALAYSGRGLNPEQIKALQGTRQALIVRFAHPKKDSWIAMHAASHLMDQLARETGGLIWDEETREIFSPDQWRKRRIESWQDGIPDVLQQTTIHAYRNGEYVRVISLGMAKFGLPDIAVDEVAGNGRDDLGRVVNLYNQAMAEGASIGAKGEFDLHLRSIRHPKVRTRGLTDLKNNAMVMGKLKLRVAARDEGDPNNRVWAISAERYPGPDAHARQYALVSALFGSEDKVVPVKNDDELLKASQAAKARLPALQAAFARGLPTGENIQLKAPFVTTEGNREWMWVEVSAWTGETIKGTLRNEPRSVPKLHAGQIVYIKQSEVFDYIHRLADGTEQGNTTGAIIARQQR